MLSVIIPCFNRGSRIQKTLLSLSGFHDAPLEVIVVDDGSSDDSVLVAERALKAIEVQCLSGRVVGGMHRGACAARNIGLRESRGDYVLFLDSDDLAESDGLTALIRCMQSSERPDIAYGWVWVQDTSGKCIAKHGTPLSECRNRIFDHPWHTSGAVYRKALLERCGGWDESLTLGDDWEFGARARLAAKKIHYEDICAGFYVQHGGGRLIATSFDRAKCKSVMRAALKIRNNAKKAYALDRALKIRLSRRLLVQASELLVNGGGYPSHRILQIVSMSKTDQLGRCIALAMRFVPVVAFRRWIYARLRAKSLT